MLAWLRSWFQTCRQEVAYRLESRARASSWAHKRNEHLRTHPYCISCGHAAETVHHGIPVSRDPTQELNDNNLFSYCNRHHFVIGHLGDYCVCNPEHADLAAIYLALTQEYRDRTRVFDINSASGDVVLVTALKLLETRYAQQMSTTAQKALKTLKNFLRKQKALQ